MNVGDLKRELAKHDPEKRVLVEGYESGYDEPVLATIRVVRLDVKESFVGEYEPISDGVQVEGAFTALIIGRKCD